ncbi:hypothetical protein D9M68_713690 [compost metagenome]
MEIWRACTISRLRVCDFTISTGTSKYSHTSFWIYSIEISFDVFLIKFFSICLASARSISFLFRVDCANRDTIAPSSSRTLLSILCATYSITSEGSSIPSPYIFFFRIAIRVSRSGTCRSADKPHLKRLSKRSSRPARSFGALSEVRMTCLPD